MSEASWSLAAAKARFSEVVERALSQGPRRVTRRGRPAVVVVPEAEWTRLSSGSGSLAKVIFDRSIRGLLTDEEVDALFARDKSPPRAVDL